MFITLETDYAVRIVNYLSMKEEKTGANDISQATGVSLRFALKILRKLVSGGIIKSYKGIYGGYILLRPPGEISLLEVVELMQGPVALSKCLDEDFVCTNNSRDDVCYFRNIFDHISKDVEEKLNAVRFSDPRH